MDFCAVALFQEIKNLKPSRVILLISNGYGEDRIASQLAHEWQQLRPQDQFLAMPLVGEGVVYQQTKIRIVGQPFCPPSEGFAYLNPLRLVQDLQAGVARHMWQQRQVLHGLRHLVSLVIAVGDIVPLLVAFGLTCPVYFVGCALSDYYVGGRYSTYDPLQRWLLKRQQTLIFPRDKLTGANLHQLGLHAVYLGNPMLDCVGDESGCFQADANRPVVAVLPGSHRDAVSNMQQVLRLLQEWPTTAWDLLAVVAAQVESNQLESALRQHDWVKINGRWHYQDLRLWLYPAQAMRQVLHFAQAALGLAGTANEQMVGYGIPVVSFVTKGKQYTWRFAEAQQRLLGLALQVIHPVTGTSLKQALQRAITDPLYRQQVSQVALERFGQSGASQRIIQWITQRGKGID